MNSSLCPAGHGAKRPAVTLSLAWVGMGLKMPFLPGCPVVLAKCHRHLMLEVLENGSW